MKSEDLTPSILYEDDALIFVDKPPNIVVQRAHDANEPVLYDLVLAHTSPLFLMQRLDRGTSGVMFFSKSAAVNAKLTRQFEQKRIRKTYLALCEGELAQRQTIDAPLKRIGPISFGVREGGRRAVTHVESVSATRNGSFIAIHLETGRTHQIRVHLAAIGHPLVGDWLYGSRNAERPMLHSAELDMTHPMTNTSLRISAPLPADFLAESTRRGIVIPRGQTDTGRVQLNY
ncbi:MAG TPA: RluA family pseudouridine synthase [Thermoanaerobaculia bacterium]|nr:RluA family pseudouridine synthase [Thermoanaerobaculia bacterium]